MPRNRPLAAMVLFGGWLLLFNPAGQRVDAPLSSWKKVDDYGTAYVCNQKRREKMQAALEKEAKEPPTAARMTPAELELRYRCERVERVPKPR